MLKHRALLKSVIDFSGDKKELEGIVSNFNEVKKSNIIFSLETHAKVYTFICEYSAKFTSVPSHKRVFKRFEEDPDIIEELEKIAKEPTLYGSNFKSLAEEVYEEQQKKDLIALLKETSTISESGKKIKKDFISGPKAAVEHFLHQSLEFLKSVSNIKMNGNMHGDSAGAVVDYYEAKSNKRFDGLLTGMHSIDLVSKGIRTPELWLMVAFVSELKTTMAMNFAYTQAIEQGKNVAFVSLEMPYSVVRDLFICIHSANLNLWPGSQWDEVYPLDYDSIQDGMLTDRQEEFFKFLCNDFDNNKEYGNLIIEQPDGGLTLSQLKAWSEIENKKKPLDILYLDYIEIMKSEGNGKDYTIDLNQRIKDLKQFAINFDGGRGLKVVSAYQTNRKGKENADKNSGEYRLDALSYANEAERSADVILYSYLNDELRENNEVKIGCLKNRSRPKFKQFKAKTLLASRKIYETKDEKDLIIDDKFSRNKNNRIKNDALINDVI